MNFILGVLLGIVAQIFTFIQIQGQFKYAWMKEHPILIAIAGVPISLLYIYSVTYLVEYYQGELWPSRILGFAIGAVVFTAMSWGWFREPLTLKTLVCLGLACCIMLVQIFWK